MTFPVPNVTTATNMPMTSPLVENTTLFQYVRPFGDVGIIVTATLIFTFLVIGLVGNVLTIFVIKSNPKLKNIFMHFILSLCVSDLISTLISWLFLYRRTWGFDNWYPMPDFLCRFYWAADLMTNYVTAMHILSFAILRYISIQFPIQFSKIKFVHGKIWITAIWTTSFLCGFIPFSIFFGAKVRDRTSGRPESRFPSCTVNLVEEYKLYQKICFPIFLYLPTFGVVLLCVLIGVIVRRRSGNGSSERQTRKENQAVLQLVLIVVSFLIGYIPFTAYEFWSIEDYPNTQYYARFDYWFGMTEYLFLRFSECLNPIFYNLGSTKMRKCTKRFLAKHFKYPVLSTSQAEVTTTASRPTADFGV